jgi:hypothetical protein
MAWGYQSDLWRPGIVHASLPEVLACSDTRALSITWLPDQAEFTYLADPFGIWQGDILHIFAEAYDYRTKRGVIHRFAYDKSFKLIDSALAMAAPHHLSYPFIIEHEEQIYMLPEAYESGRLTLFRAKEFPGGWEPVCDLLDQPAIDASVTHHNGLWWMFYTLPGPNRHAESALYVASSKNLTGPWKAHDQNPVQRGMESSRPGGTPVVVDGELLVPTQDCTQSYGGAINLLHVSDLTPTTWQARMTRHFAGKDFAGAWTDGLHTLSACGPVTLIDCKRIERSARRALINWQRRWQRWTAKA